MKVVFEIEINGVRQSIKSVNDLKEAVKATNQALGNADVGSDEYKKLQATLGQLKASQKGVRDETRLQQRQFEQTTKFARGSYRALNAELVNLRNQYKNLSEADRNSNLGRGLLKDIGKLDTRLKALDKNIGQYQRSIGNYQSALNGLGNFFKGAILVGGVQRLGQAVLDSVSLFADFTNQVAILQAVSGASAEKIAELESEAKRLGETTFFTASQVAELQTNFARGGFNPDEIIAMTQATLDLSIATGEELSDASQVVASNLRAFGLEANESEKFVNTLTTTLNRSNQRLGDFAEASKELAPTARLLGISSEEASAAIGILADNGLRGTTATTTLSTSLIRLSDNSKKYAKAANELGIEVFNQQGEFVGLAQLLENVNTATEGYTEEQKAAAVSQIFGIQAARNFNILLNAQKEVVTENGSELLKGADALRGFTQELDNTGNSAQRAADVVGNTLTGDIKTFQSAFEGVQIAINERFENVTRGIVQFGTAIVRGLGQAFDFIANAFEPVVQAFRDYFSEVSEGNIISELFEGVLQLLGGTLVVFANAIARTVNFATFLISSFKDLALAIPGVSQAFDFTRQVVVTLIDGLSKVPAFLNGVGKAFDQFITDAKNLTFSTSNISQAFSNGFDDALIRQKAKASMDAATDEVKKGTQDINNNLGNVPNEVGKASKKASELVAGSVAFLKAEIDKLKKELETSTSPETFASIQREIDKTEQKLNELIGKGTLAARGNFGTIERLGTVDNTVTTTTNEEGITTTSATQLTSTTAGEEQQGQADSDLESLKTGVAEQQAAARAKIRAEELADEERVNQQRLEIYGDAANGISDAFTSFVTDQEVTFQDFQRQILTVALDALERTIQLAAIEATAKLAAANPILGLVAGAGINLAIRSLFGLARNAIQGFADGGSVQPYEYLGAGKITKRPNIKRSNGDNILATVRTGEMILNEGQQSKLEAYYGRGIWGVAGVPGFADGGVASDVNIIPALAAASLQRQQTSVVVRNVVSIPQEQIEVIGQMVARGAADGSRQGTAEGQNNLNREQERQQILNNQIGI